MIPTDEQINHIFDVLKADPKVWDRRRKVALAHAARARAGTTDVDGFKSSHGMGGTGGGNVWLVENEAGEEEAVPVTSVEAMSQRTAQPDPIDRMVTLELDLYNQAAMSVQGGDNVQEKVNKTSTYEPPIGHRAPPCKNATRGCTGEAVSRGLCDTDRKWVERHRQPNDVDPIVPQSVIDEREIVRKKRKKIA